VERSDLECFADYLKIINFCKIWEFSELRKILFKPCSSLRSHQAESAVGFSEGKSKILIAYRNNAEGAIF
jgi:hypothetical protein